MSGWGLAFDRLMRVPYRLSSGLLASDGKLIAILLILAAFVAYLIESW